MRRPVAFLAACVATILSVRAAPARADDDQGVPRLDAPRGLPSRDEFDPTSWDPRLPPLGHPIPRRTRVSLRTDPVAGGSVQTFPVDATTTAVVMVGNPVVESDDFVVKAETVVVWLDATKESAFGLGLPAARDDRTPDAAKRAGDTDSVIPEAVLAIYAEGAVDLVSDDLAFRASELYLDARTDRALLVEPRFDTSAEAKAGESRVPIHVRANTMKNLARGFAVFEEGEVSTSRATERVALRVRVLTMEELGDAAAGRPTFLGFRTAGTQRFAARDVVGRALGVPLLYVPEAAFGGTEGLAGASVRLTARTGSRSSLGRYALVGVGRTVPLADDATVDVVGWAGGYSKRGPAAGVDTAWRSPSARDAEARVKGRLQAFGVYDLDGRDRDDYAVEEGLRGEVLLENRWELSRPLRLDTEAAVFSDRGFHREFFDADERTHKDRETYTRLRWLTGGTTAALTAGFHLRDFATETLEQPGLSLWSESLPLGETSGPIRLAFDLESAASVARLLRRFDLATEDEGYEALRTDVTERIHAPFDVGDVRISPFAGVRWTAYTDRTDGGDDVSRTALEAGVRANLQLSLDRPLVGGPWRLDGWRHVMDLDVGAFTRRGDGTSPDEVPFFDRVDLEEDRTEVFFEWRNRLETRRVTGDARSGVARRNATLADLRVRTSLWPEDVGPYGRRGIGEVLAWGMAEITPETAWLRGEAAAGLEGVTFRHWSLGIEWVPDRIFRGAAGVRHVQDEVLAPWFEGYARWNEKWGARLSAIRDFDSPSGANVRLALLRFGDDLRMELGCSLRDDGRDVQFFFSIDPAVGGEPLSSPFDPREAVDFTP